MIDKTMHNKDPIMVAARDVVKELGQGAGKVQALKGVSLELPPGELTLLMGPSGSGKTTLLSILGCILSPTSGSVSIAGEETVGLDPEALADVRRRHIGFIFQSYNLFPTLTARENVLLALDVRGMGRREAEDRADTALREVGLTHRMRAYPSHMSGGEQQRVAVARAISSAPSVILADEPTAALDSENGQAVMELLAEIAQDKSRAILVVTHDHRTLDYADRILRIEDGHLIGDDRAEKSEDRDARETLKKRRQVHV